MVAASRSGGFPGDEDAVLVWYAVCGAVEGNVHAACWGLAAGDGVCGCESEEGEEGGDGCGEHFEVREFVGR